MYYIIEDGVIAGKDFEAPKLTNMQDWYELLPKLGYEQISISPFKSNASPTVSFDLYQSENPNLHWMVVTRMQDNKFIGSYRIDNSLDLASVLGKLAAS